MGFLSVPNLVLWLIFIVGSSASSQISFSRSDCSSKTHPPSLPLWVSIVGYLQWWKAGTIIRGRRLIEGRLFFSGSSRNSVSLCLKRKHHVPRQDLSKYKWSICTENDLFTKRMLILSYDPLLSDYSSIRFSETETNFRLSGNSRKNLMSF